METKTTQKRIWLWGVPRSTSTAFGKTFSQRNDTELIHEPFAECYYFSGNRKSSRYGENSELSSYGLSDVEAKFAVDASIVFAKDLAFQAFDYVTDDFLNEATHSFIIRHPHKVFSSLKKLKPDFTEEEFGFTALEVLWERIVNQLGHVPILVDGERFQSEPERVLRTYCERVGTPFQREMLSWESGLIRSWKSEDYEVHTKWHKSLEASRTINPPSDAPLDLGMTEEQKQIVERAIAIYHRLLPFAI